jgi:hypothetical protein
VSRVFFNRGSVNGGPALLVVRAALADIAATGRGRPRTGERPQKGAVQATVRSATKTFPLVSGLRKTATRKMAKPTTVVTRIGPESDM